MEHLQDGAIRGIRRLRQQGLVTVWIEHLARRVELGHTFALEQRPECTMDQCHAIGDGIVLGGFKRLECALKIVKNRQEVTQATFGCALAQLLVLTRHALLVIVEFGCESSQLIEIVVAIALGQRQRIELFFNELGLNLRDDRLLPALGGEGSAKRWGGPTRYGRCVLRDARYAGSSG